MSSLGYFICMMYDESNETVKNGEQNVKWPPSITEIWAIAMFWKNNIET